MKWKCWFDEGWKGGIKIVIFVKREIASNIRLAKVMIEDKGDIGIPNKREGEKRGRRKRTKVLYLMLDKRLEGWKYSGTPPFGRPRLE